MKGIQYVEAARSLGSPSWRIIFRHIAPQCIGTYLVLVTTSLGIAIVLEATLGSRRRFRLPRRRGAACWATRVHADPPVAPGASFQGQPSSSRSWPSISSATACATPSTPAPRHQPVAGRPSPPASATRSTLSSRTKPFASDWRPTGRDARYRDHMAEGPSEAVAEESDNSGHPRSESGLAPRSSVNHPSAPAASGPLGVNAPSASCCSWPSSGGQNTLTRCRSVSARSLMPVLRADVVAHARLELPGLPRREVGDAARAGDDVVRLPVVLVPERRSRRLPRSARPRSRTRRRPPSSAAGASGPAPFATVISCPAARNRVGALRRTCAGRSAAPGRWPDRRRPQSWRLVALERRAEDAHQVRASASASRWRSFGPTT